MSAIINIVSSFFQLFLTYVVFITIIVTNDVRVLMIGVLLFAIIKYLHYLFGKDLFFFTKDTEDCANMTTIYSSLIATEVDKPLGEDIFINIGLLIVMNKLFYFLVFKNVVDMITEWLSKPSPRMVLGVGGGGGGGVIVAADVAEMVDTSLMLQDKVNL